ncbi:MAG: hypothetical protein V7K92_30185 [Nostoc sp.]|uniref:hypothetical protein n=1 Tax=Nostoc sp. TaxID=1180 RepID=UPI002FF0112C
MKTSNLLLIQQPKDTSFSNESQFLSNCSFVLLKAEKFVAVFSKFWEKARGADETGERNHTYFDRPVQ